LPPPFKRALSRHLSEPFFLPGHATAAMGLAVRQMLTCGLRGSLARMYLEAKVTELIALRLAQVGEEPAGERRLVLTRRDRELLHEARAILSERYAEPPTISELAREVALNRTKLKAGFRELFGTTVFGFVRAQRMREAFEVLLDGTCNVTEAANRVGYNSPGAFAAVFKAAYGFSPHRTRELEF
ncbi:MAG: helix-turn-helix transcriptional regulator, partial [Spirochaetales bacterium]|nr:helix-turn-helix transcriptional regulator [Spirochaetales bacterium]